MKTGYKAPTKAELAEKEKGYYSDRSAYFDMAQKANELSKVNQSSYVLAQADSLKLIQIDSEKKIRSFGKFKDEHSRATFFGRNANNVIADLEYALPKAQERVGASSTTKAVEKVNKIDSDIEDLQKQLDALQ
jgi:hypothetical protein